MRGTGKDNSRSKMQSEMASKTSIRKVEQVFEHAE